MEINKIILGTVQLGLEYGINNTLGKPKFDDAIELLLLAYNSGIRTVDTAEGYGDSQKIIGEYHSKYPEKKFQVISKFLCSQLIKNSLIETVNHDLLDLKIDFLYGYMFHSYEDYYNSTKEIDDLIHIKKSGLIKKLGVSVYTNKEFEIVVNDNRIDFVQIPFNLLDNSTQKGDLIISAKKKNKELHIRSVFLQGLFFKDRNKLPEKLVPLKRYLLIIDSIASSTGVDIEDLALNYVTQQTLEIDNILIGVDSKEQLIKDLSYLTSKTDYQNAFMQIDQINIKNIELLNPTNWV